MPADILATFIALIAKNMRAWLTSSPNMLVIISAAKQIRKAGYRRQWGIAPALRMPDGSSGPAAAKPITQSKREMTGIQKYLRKFSTGIPDLANSKRKK